MQIKLITEMAKILKSCNVDIGYCNDRVYAYIPKEIFLEIEPEKRSYDEDKRVAHAMYNGVDCMVIMTPQDWEECKGA